MKPTRNIRRVFDLHCDTLTECYKQRMNLKDNPLHFSLDKVPDGMGLCQAMAVFIPDELRGGEAVAYFDAVYGYFRQQLGLFGTEMEQTVIPMEIPSILKEGKVAALLTVEGGAVLGGRLEQVAKLYSCGVRMMTLTWNGANELCGGAATDEGFTPFGRQVVEEMERLGMAVDVSHLSDRGFYQLCGFATRPFVASHSNARAVCSHRRNLTDGMFREISNRGGVVGLNYYKNFIVDDGNSTGMDDLLRHAHHFLELGGEDTLCLGSDFDGADLPDYIDGVHRLPALMDALERSGIPAPVVDKIVFGNAYRYFGEIANGGTDH